MLASNAEMRLPSGCRRFCVLLLLLWGLVDQGASADADTIPDLRDHNVRTVFLTDCQMYSDWQSVAMIFSLKKSGQPGPVTRVMCCSPEVAAAYPQEMLSLVNTHFAPSMTVHPVTGEVGARTLMHRCMIVKWLLLLLRVLGTRLPLTIAAHLATAGDHYAAYNKPEAVIDWLAHYTPQEEWILVVDSDMLLRHPFTPEVFQTKKGLAIGARYTYMIGVDNELAKRHIPEVSPRNDTLAGPFGRRADQVPSAVARLLHLHVPFIVAVH